MAYNGMGTGLGNRMRVVLGCQVLAEQEQRRLLYVWPTGPRFGPRLPELFDFHGGRALPRSVSRVLARRYPYVDESLDWLDDARRGQRVWQIRTGSEINLPPGAPSWGERLRRLTPSADIRDRIGRLFDGPLRAAPYVGVMIRAHQVSHATTLAASPVPWFVDRMRVIRRELPDVTFFLSCDVPEVAGEVSEALGGCVTQPDKGGYNTTAGVKSAVVDLYLLASASHLVAPHYSSFIHLAQHLNGDVVPIETSRTDTPPRIDLSAGAVADPLNPWRRHPVPGP